MILLSKNITMKNNKVMLDGVCVWPSSQHTAGALQLTFLCLSTICSLFCPTVSLFFVLIMCVWWQGLEAEPQTCSDSLKSPGCCCEFSFNSKEKKSAHSFVCFLPQKLSQLKFWEQSVQVNQVLLERFCCVSWSGLFQVSCLGT